MSDKWFRIHVFHFVIISLSQIIQAVKFIFQQHLKTNSFVQWEVFELDVTLCSHYFWGTQLWVFETKNPENTSVLPSNSCSQQRSEIQKDVI